VDVKRHHYPLLGVFGILDQIWYRIYLRRPPFSVEVDGVWHGRSARVSTLRWVKYGGRLSFFPKISRGTGRATPDFSIRFSHTFSFPKTLGFGNLVQEHAVVFFKRPSYEEAIEYFMRFAKEPYLNSI
jgi:hypothetical protein